jgi:UDP-N-acetylmuramate dehydrogenase
MRVEDPKFKAELAAIAVELRPGASLAALTSLGIGGTTDLLRITKHQFIPELISLLERHHIAYKFLGGGSNLLVGDGELPWVILQLAKPDPEIVLNGNLAHVDAAADLGRTVTYCAKHDLGGMEASSASRHRGGAHERRRLWHANRQFRPRSEAVWAAERKLETQGHEISFEYRHTSLPLMIRMLGDAGTSSKSFKEISRDRICNEKRRSSQPPPAKCRLHLQKPARALRGLVTSWASRAIASATPRLATATRISSLTPDRLLPKTCSP